MEDGSIRGMGMMSLWHMEQKVGLQGVIVMALVLLVGVAVCGAGVMRVVEQEHVP